MSFAEPGARDALPLHLVGAEDAAARLAALSGAEAAWARFHGFAGQLGRSLILPAPGPDGRPGRVLLGTGTAAERARQRFAVGAAIAALPEATYAVQDWPADHAAEIALGYLFALYRFDRYRAQPQAMALLVAPDVPGLDPARLVRIAEAEALTRDLVNTPAEDMGPAEVEAAARGLGDAFGARVETVEGDALLERNLPLIHAVGRAAARAPRLIELNWGGPGGGPEGGSGPALTLVGKGVCFDTGGLNLKPGASMGLMKKDMGGAANVLGLARMIMSEGLDLRLRVLIPAVENAVSGNAFRPGDILTARTGATVEINNTDAEGRLVLADALALAAETPPDLLVSVATLTGAARVALGGDIAPFYTDDDTLAGAIATGARAMADPVWRMPFHAPYEAQIEPGIADLDNAPSGGMAGSITAALFLRRFAQVPRFVHWDIYAWQAAAAPGRPKGGLGQGMRALFAALPDVLRP